MPNTKIDVKDHFSTQKTDVKILLHSWRTYSTFMKSINFSTMQSNCDNDKIKKYRNRLLGRKLRSIDESSRKVLCEVQPRDDTHGQRRRSQPPLSLESNTSLRKSLAWDSAFSTSQGAFDLEELMKTLNLHDAEYVNNNSRPSLAWDSDFFTSEGVLNAEELSIIHNGLPKTSTAIPPRMENDLLVSNKKRKSIDKENMALWNLENDLFKDRNDYAFRSKGSTGSTPKLQGWLTGQSREATSNLDHPSKNMMLPMLSSTRKPVTDENTEQSLKEISHRPPCQIRAAKEEECKLSLVPKRLRRNSLLNLLSRKHDSIAKISPDDCARIYTKNGIVSTTMSDIKRGRASSIYPNLNAAVSRPKSPLRCSREKTNKMENPPYYVFTTPVSLTEKCSWKPSFSRSTSHKYESSESFVRASLSEMPEDSIQEVAFAGGISPAVSTDVRNKNKPSSLQLPSPKIRLSNEKLPIVPTENRTPARPFGRENNASNIQNRSCNLNNSAERARTPTKTVSRSGYTKIPSLKSGALRSPLITRSPHPQKLQNSSLAILREHTKQHRTTGSRQPLKSTIQNVKDGQVSLRASKRFRNEHGEAGTQYAGILFGTTLDDDKENLAFVDSDYNLGNKTDIWIGALQSKQ